MSSYTTEQLARIVQLNDNLRALRKSENGHDRIVMTIGFRALPDNDRALIYRKVCEFKNFTKDNDPYGEHDFGKVQHNNQDVFWKIDYYDPAMEYHSEDPSDHKKTVRVLTIMLACEW